MEDSSKTIYSLKELVEEIYDIDKNSNCFDSNYKDLQRIDSALRGSSDYYITKGILKENKDKYVKLIKKIISNDEIKKIVKKIGKNKILTEEEDKKYVEFMLDNFDSGDSLKENIEELKKINKRITKIENEVKYILYGIPKYFECESTDLMNIVLDVYEEGIKKLHQEIKNKCKELDSIDNTVFEEKLIALLKYGEKNLKDEKNLKIKK